MYVPFYEAVRNFFREHVVWGGKDVPAVYAGPDRAHEEIRRVMADREASRNGIATTPQAQSDRPLPVPFMSILIQPPKYDPEFYSPHRVVLDKDYDKGTAIVAKAPWPFVADVQVDLWCGSAGGGLMAMSIQPQVEQRFTGGHLTLPIDWTDKRWYRPPYNVSEHAMSWGQTRVRLYTDGWADNSDIESGESAKETRLTWSGRLKGFVPFRPEQARIVRTVPLNIEHLGVDPVEVLDTVVGGVED